MDEGKNVFSCLTCSSNPDFLQSFNVSFTPNKNMAIDFKEISAKVGWDSAIAYTVLTRVVQSVVGIMTLFMITLFFDKNEQGYFYTFLSILSIRFFFELGLTSVLTQYVAHEFAHLSWKNESELVGNEYYLSRLASIIQLSIKWFVSISVILFIVLLTAGKIFFSEFNKELNIEWQMPWLVLSISTSVMLLLDLFFAVMEGLGKIEQITKLRLIQQLINLFCIAILIIADFKLLSNGLALLISTGIIIIVLFLSGHIKIIKNLWIAETKWKVNYRKEILPFQSRVALGNISNYFIFQLFNPLLFATQGPILAGQMGATQTCLSGVSAIASSWMSTKVPFFSLLVAKRKFKLLNLLFKKNLIISFIVCLAGLAFFNIALLALKEYFPEMSNRFLNFIPVVFLSLTQLANVIGSAQGYYLRSFKKDPFFVSAIVIGVLTGLSTIISSKYFGINGITIGCFLINGFIGLAWGTMIFINKKKEWLLLL